MKKIDNRNIYVSFNDERVSSSGITISEFIKYNDKDISKLLLLKSEVLGNVQNIKYHFELIEGKEEIYRILNYEDTGMGSLNFVDYKNKEDINNLTKEEIMHMLYFVQCHEKLEFLINDKLFNHYAYYCHDNDWYIEIFCRDIESYIKTLMNVLANKININSYKIEDVELLIDIIKKGVIFNISDNKIKIYEVGYLNNIDDIDNKSEELINDTTFKYDLDIIDNKIRIVKRV